MRRCLTQICYEGNDGFSKENKEEPGNGVENCLLCLVLCGFISLREDETDASDNKDDCCKEAEEIQDNDQSTRYNATNIGASGKSTRNATTEGKSFFREEQRAREERCGKGD